MCFGGISAQADVNLRRRAFVGCRSGSAVFFAAAMSFFTRPKDESGASTVTSALRCFLRRKEHKRRHPEDPTRVTSTAGEWVKAQHPLVALSPAKHGSGCLLLPAGGMCDDDAARLKFFLFQSGTAKG